MPEALTDVAALMGALDRGEDNALPYLADALEEEGQDARAAGMRLVHDRRPTGKNPACWHRQNGERAEDYAARENVSPTVFARLVGHTGCAESSTPQGWAWVGYTSRSAAYLALAAALAKGERPCPTR